MVYIMFRGNGFQEKLKISPEMSFVYPTKWTLKRVKRVLPENSLRKRWKSTQNLFWMSICVFTT